MTSPLEAMAKAAYDDYIEPVKSVEEVWDRLPESHRDRLMSSMRAALLALAEAELSEAMINLGYNEPDINAHFVDETFRAICRALAED